MAYCTKDIDLGRLCLLGQKERTKVVAESKSILSDALEAVIGAIFLDGGIEPAKDLL